MASRQSKPLFFQHLSPFLESLPTKLESACNHSEYLQSYLDHYRLDLQKAGLASHYCICRSPVANYHIVEQRWQPQAPSLNQTLIVVHGYMDHTGLYGQLIAWALQRGYEVHSFDLPGHGLSSGAQAAIDSFDDYTDVLSHILQREAYTDYTIVGQSTGCAVILNGILNPRYVLAIPAAIALFAPLVRSHLWHYLRYLYFLLRPIVPAVRRRFHQSSHNHRFNHFLEYKDPLQAKRIPLCWLGAMEQWTKAIKSFPVYAQQTVPLIIQGTADGTVDRHYNLAQIKAKCPHSQLIEIEDAGHQLVNESDEYWQVLVRALDKDLGLVASDKVD
ncbi:MAG: alpha/beta hydrolase [Pseudomonadota bacterium]